jgi:superfamily II DNA or RNA helicase
MKNEKTHFKHFIYTDLRESAYGAKAIGSFLKDAGYDFLMARGSSSPSFSPRKEGFALLQAQPLFGKPTSVKTRKDILTTFNERPGNVHGEKLRILVLDSRFKEGVDLFDVKYVHIMEPSLTTEDLTQAVGRATRFCGQRGLRFQPSVGWPLQVFVYNTELPGRAPFLQDGEAAQKISAHDIVLRESGLDLSKFAFSAELGLLAQQTAVDKDLTKAFLQQQSQQQQSQQQQQGGAYDWKGVKPILDSRKIRGATLRKCSTRKTSLFPFSKEHLVRIAAQMKLRIRKSAPRAAYCALLSENQAYLSMMYRTLSLTTPPKKTRKAKKAVATAEAAPEPVAAVPVAAPEEPIPVVSAEGTFAAFQARIQKDFAKFAWKKPDVKNGCEADPKRIPDYTPTQEFVRHYLTPASPFKGLLAWHSVGTGKTCLAVAAASSFEASGYTILWVTRRSLIPDVSKNLWDTVCHVGLRKRFQETGALPTEADKRRKLLPQWIAPISYKAFQNATQGRNELGRALRRKNGEDPLKKTFIVLDEVHKLQDGDLGPLEAADFATVQAAIRRSYDLSKDDSARLLLLTATPGEGLLELLNTLIPEKDKRLPTSFQSLYFGDGKRIAPEGVRLFQERAKGLLSYLTREKDPTTFAQPRYETIDVPLQERLPVTAESVAEALAVAAPIAVPHCDPIVKGLTKEEREDLRECRKRRDAATRANKARLASAKKAYTKKRRAFLASPPSQYEELVRCLDPRTKPAYPSWASVLSATSDEPRNDTSTGAYIGHPQ